MSGCVHKWMSIREGQDICNCRNDSNQSYCTHVARKLEAYGQELRINNFFVQLIQKCDKNGKRIVVAGQ